VAAPESALRNQLQILRARNDSAMTEIETATLRGHIQVFEGSDRLGRGPASDRR
jgi:hypothetical protein